MFVRSLKSNLLSSSSSWLNKFHSRRWGGTLVVADHNDEGVLNSTTLSTITAATQLPHSPIDILLAGSNVSSTAEQLKKVGGVKGTILVAQNKNLKGLLPEDLTKLLLSLISSKGYEAILGGATSMNKGLLPRVAAKLDVSPVSEITAVLDGGESFQRPIYAGNALQTIKILDKIKVMTVRGTNFEKAAPEGGDLPIEELKEAIDSDGKSEWISQELSKSERPELGSANRVISGGRGMKSGENFEMLYKLADKINAAVGASRAAVDAGYVPNDMQVGQTGKIVAPELYVAVGISGAIQHLAGMKDSKTIVAINKDPDAPIFQVSDLGLVADLFKAIPEIDSKIDFYIEK